MATAPANAIEEFDEIEEFPDVIEEFDEPVDVGQEAQRSAAGALQTVDLMTLPGRIMAAQPRELSRDEQLFQQSESVAAQMRQAEDAGQSSAGLSDQYFALRNQIDPNFLRQVGAREFAPDEAAPVSTPDGVREANWLGRGLSELAQAAGLTPLAGDIEAAGKSPIGLNFQANIGAAATGAAGAGLMMVPGAQPLGARTFAQMAAPMAAPLIGGVTGSMAGTVAQEKIHAATETPEETEARHAALAEVQQNFPAQSMLGGSMANIFTMRPSLSQFLQAAAGNKNAQMSIAGAAGIGASMGVGLPMITGQPVTLAGIAQSALENMVFNKPTALGRKLGLPPMEGGPAPREVEPVEIGSEATPPAPDATPVVEPTPEVVFDPRTAIPPDAPEVPLPVAEPPVVEPAPEVVVEPTPAPEATPPAPAPEPTGPVVEDVGSALPPPRAPVAGEGEPTGIRNAVVDRARAEAGIPPRELPLARSFPQIHAEASAALANDPSRGARLVDELAENIRPLDDTDDAILTFEQNSREQERAAAVDAVNSTPEGEAQDAAIARLAAADDALFTIYQVGQQAGTANARGLNARKMMQNRDFTLSKMLNDTRAIVNNGDPLSAKQTEETTALYNRINDLEKEVAGLRSKETSKSAKSEFQKIIRQTKKEAGEASKAKEDHQTFLQRTRENARKRIIGRRGKLQVTIDPLNIAGLADEAVIGATYVAEGVRDFAKWSDQMVSDFGERIRPHLEALFQRAAVLGDDISKEYNAKTPKTPEAILSGIKDGVKLEQRTVYDLARAHVNAGMDDFDQVMTRVTEDLKPRFPEITERRVMDALSGYGKTSTPSKQEDLRKLREFRNLARLTSQLEDAQNKIPPKKTGAQRDKPTTRVRELQKKVNNAMRAAGIERTGPDQIASGLQASKTRIKNLTEELQTRINRNDYEERPRREPALDREKIDLQFELSKVKEKWNQGLIEAKRAKRPLGEKIWDAGVETINLGRQLLTSADLPPVFRQGLFGIGRPVQAAKAAAEATKAIFSEKKRFSVMKEIDERPNAPLYSRSKLYFARDGNQSLNQMEENFMGNWFKQLPRWTLVGPILRASERSYNTFLNKMRADTFDSLVKAFNISETDTATLNSLAANINTFTGRSTLPLKKLEQAAPGLNTFLFAPRFMMSRFKVATGQPLWTGTRKSKLAALDTYARTLGGLAVIYSLANLAGGDVETDPRSSDFGKIKFGQTRLDPLGGLSQVTTFLTRVTTGETKTGKGRLVPLREQYRPLVGTGLEAKGKPNLLVGDTTKVMGNFLRSKLNPIVGTGVNLAAGKNIVGEKVTAGDALIDMSVPISWQEIFTTMEKQGIPRGPALFILSLFGMGLNTYEDRKK